MSESGQKPTSTMTFDRAVAAVKELAGLVRWSDRLEAESFAEPGIRALVQSAIADAAAEWTGPSVPL